MNIVTFGGEKLAYCETVAGGAGAKKYLIFSLCGVMLFFKGQNEILIFTFLS